MFEDARNPALMAAVRVRAGVSIRAGPRPGLVAFGIAFAGALAVALGQGPKPFYYDSGLYWTLGESFIRGGHFSLLNFDSQARGYALPLFDHGLRGLARGLGWSESSVVKLFNALTLASIGAVLAPALAELAWPRRRWGAGRRVVLMALLALFWSGYLNFPLSDFPALAMVLLALVAISRTESPGWMLVAGAAGGMAIDMRAAYLLLGPILIVLCAWTWLERRGGRHASIARRMLCAGLLVGGFAVVSLPQSLSAHRYSGTWSFLPGATVSLSDQYLTPGLANQRYDTYVGPGAPPGLYYGDTAGARLLSEQRGERIAGVGQYLGLIVSHPLTMGALLARHAINGLDVRYSTPYIEHLETGSHRWLRLGGFLLVFLALARVLWPAARRGLGGGRWRYPVGLLLCCSTSLAALIETRYLLPAYLFVYVLVLAPGWPSPLGPAAAGLRRFRTLAVLVAAYAVFTAVVWHVVEGATGNRYFG
jgi:hypothetical protein